MKNIRTFVLTAVSILGMYSLASGQIQKGAAIDGQFINENSGYAVSMPDPNTVAIGAPYSDQNLVAAGNVRIFRWNGSAWVQKGTAIEGEATGDISGYAVSMPDSNTVAIGAPHSDENGSNSGQVRIFTWNGSIWAQKGVDLAGAITTDKFGTSVTMPDANTVAIGAPFHNGIGLVYVYKWNGSAWVLQGNTIWGEGQSDQAGCAVSMPDANTLAIGALANQGTNGTAGHVRIYLWNGSGWIQKGPDIDGEGGLDYFGTAVSMPDSNTVAIGGPYNDNSNGGDAGHVRIFDWNGSTWSQRGSDIDGEASSNGLGTSISMPDVNTIAVGAPYHSSGSGQVQIFSWNGSTWLQTGSDVIGEAAEDFCGTSVSMPDANTVAIGAPENSSFANNAGHVRVFTMNPATGIMENNNRSAITVYPVPTSGRITIDLGDEQSEARVVVRNAIGQEIENRVYASVKEVELTIEGSAGIYFVEVTSHDQKSVVKVVKE